MLSSIHVLEQFGINGHNAELGDRFDIREFHHVVLTNGSMPLGILEYLVKEYIANKANELAGEG